MILIVFIIIFIVVFNIIKHVIENKKPNNSLDNESKEIQTPISQRTQNITNNDNQTQQNDNAEHPNTYQNEGHKECLDCDLNEKYENNKQEIISDIKTVKKYCMYCGASTTENISKCPNCKADMNG